MAQTLATALFARTIASSSSTSCHTARTLSQSRRKLTPCQVPHLAPPTTRARFPFSTTAPALKRGGGKKHVDDDTTSAAASGRKNRNSRDAEGSDAVDPPDPDVLADAVKRGIDRLKSQIAELRKGGRDVAAIEELPVTLVKGEAQAVKLGEVAQVMARGRVLVVMAGDKKHVKPILSALNNSPNSLAPVMSPSNPLEVHIPLPPPTGESRSAAVDAAAKLGEAAGVALSSARATYKKKLRQLELSKSMRPDELRKAGEAMEKVVGAGTAEVKRLIEGVRKGS
ncbi:hypothetical protein MMC07_007589 [Pseudocyphellaria aurata]|nr:hypothetical protein [Pseudocyphellaria aurata]